MENLERKLLLFKIKHAKKKKRNKRIVEHFLQNEWRERI